MAITNGYASLPEARERVNKAYRRVGTGIAFDSAAKKITDTSKGLQRFATDDIIQVSGSTGNDGLYTVATGAVAAEIVTSEALTDEAAGDEITIQTIQGGANYPATPGQDALLEQIVEAASRAIDAHTGTTFYAATDTRSYFVGKHTCGRTLRLDRWLLSVTTLTNGNGTVITSDEYTFRPVNDAPYYEIVLTVNSSKQWEYTDDPEEDPITVLGSWGYSSTTPANIKEACLMLTNRLWKRVDAPFGVAGASQFGGVIVQQIPIDHDIKMLLQPYLHRTGW
jgi:hypothetical protein